MQPPGAQKGVSESDHGGIFELGRAVSEDHGEVCLPTPCPLQALWLHHRGGSPQHKGVECAEWIRGHETGREAIDDVGPTLFVHATGQHECMAPQTPAAGKFESISFPSSDQKLPNIS